MALNGKQNMHYVMFYLVVVHWSFVTFERRQRNFFSIAVMQCVSYVWGDKQEKKRPSRACCIGQHRSEHGFVARVRRMILKQQQLSDDGDKTE